MEPRWFKHHGLRLPLIRPSPKGEGIAAPDDSRPPMLIEPPHATTDLLALHRLAPQRYPLLLESTAAGRQGRWDMLLMADGGQLRLDTDGYVRREDDSLVEGDFLTALDHEWQALRLPREADASDVPFRGGWA